MVAIAACALSMVPGAVRYNKKVQAAAVMLVKVCLLTLIQKVA